MSFIPLVEDDDAMSRHWERLQASLNSEFVYTVGDLIIEEDDATSKLAETQALVGSGQSAPSAVFQEEPKQNEFPCAKQYLGKDSADIVSNCQVAASIDYPQFNLNQDMQNNQCISSHRFEETQPMMVCPPAAIIKQKCALWDCLRPTQRSDCCQDYCCSDHAYFALNDGLLGVAPVVRPGGIDLKDGSLFASLAAKAQTKDVGIPECEGAATTKSPWNAFELFNLSVLEGESLIECLFFDKPRRAFKSGNRKRRSLPDYKGRGWHESRKQVMEEFGGLKRSYYMDPQPFDHLLWHLSEYELNNWDAWALYRLELKHTNHKKDHRAKPNHDLFVELQRQLGKHSAEHCSDKKRRGKGIAK